MEKLKNWKMFNENYSNELYNLKNKKLFNRYIINYNIGPIGVLNLHLATEADLENGKKTSEFEIKNIIYFSAATTGKGEWDLNDFNKFGELHPKDQILLDKIANIIETQQW